jgi:exopolyphosphatase/guanosine-5'-triphosphate,3'-diphosphate pyrophosphatase
MDIGGGSVEVSIVYEDSVVFSDSIKAGAVRLLQFLNDKGSAVKVLQRFLKQYTYGVFQEMERERKLHPVTKFVGTGGNIESLGLLRTSLLGKSASNILKLDELGTIIEQLTSLTVPERIARLKLRPDRADVIVPASVLLQLVATNAGVNEILIPGVGLREGVLLSMAAELGEPSPGQVPAQPAAYALELGRRLNFDELHGVTVARHADELFEQTRPRHSLSNEYGLLLRLAALLHDVGQVISMSGHHKHSFYIIKTSPFMGLSKRQKHIVATVARYHRKAPPSIKHEAFAQLEPSDREPVRVLCALVRVADALDREHAARVRSFRISFKGKEAQLKLDGDGDLMLERWAVRKKCDLFEEIFLTKLSIKD